MIATDTEHETIIDSNEWVWVIVASSMLLLLVSLPFVLAYAAAGSYGQFNGVLVNPIDGATYQAKMVEGYMGSWLFHLPYTPEPHRGVFLLTFYLGLGHIARLLNAPIILVFHAARLIGSLLMFLAIYLFVANWTRDVIQRRVTWGLAVVAGGFGWLALLFGVVTPDVLALPEAFPLQAAYTNPHFPWSIAVALWLTHTLLSVAVFSSTRWPKLDAETVGLIISTLFLVSVAPFVLLPIAIAYGVLCVSLWIKLRQFPRRQLAWGGVLLIFGAPLVAYSLWATSSANPIFEAWMSQNVTPSPEIWKYLVAFGPLLALALVGLWGQWHRLSIEHIFLIGWLVAIVLLLYAPLSLQRRFSMGITVPLAVFAGIGLWRVVFPAVAKRWHTMLVIIVLSLTAPSTIMALAIPLVGARQPSEDYYFYTSGDELQMLSWLQGHADPRDAVVLASPQVSLILPIHGLRVVYGHPFETIHAQEREKSVIDFYSGKDCSVIEREGVRYVVVGQRERDLAAGSTSCPIPGKQVFSTPDGEIEVYEVTAP